MMVKRRLSQSTRLSDLARGDCVEAKFKKQATRRLQDNFTRFGTIIAAVF